MIPKLVLLSFLLIRNQALQVLKFFLSFLPELFIYFVLVMELIKTLFKVLLLLSSSLLKLISEPLEKVFDFIYLFVSYRWLILRNGLRYDRLFWFEILMEICIVKFISLLLLGVLKFFLLFLPRKLFLSLQIFLMFSISLFLFQPLFFLFSFFSCQEVFFYSFGLLFFLSSLSFLIFFFLCDLSKFFSDLCFCLELILKLLFLFLLFLFLFEGYLLLK